VNGAIVSGWSAIRKLGGVWASATDSGGRGHGLKFGREQPPHPRVIGRMLAPAARKMLPVRRPFKKMRFSTITDSSDFSHNRDLI